MRNRNEFVKAISEVVNRYSIENGSNTPDFILADYIADVVDAWNEAVRRREAWYGRDTLVTNPPKPVGISKGCYGSCQMGNGPCDCR